MPDRLGAVKIWAVRLGVLFFMAGSVLMSGPHESAGQMYGAWIFAGLVVVAVWLYTGFGAKDAGDGPDAE